MKARSRRWSFFAWSAGLGTTALIPGVAFAQSSEDALPIIFTGVFLICVLAFGLAIYIYMALALQTIANKTRTENPWLAWIPIANVILMVMIAKKPIWWIVLLFVPVANIVILILVWMAIAEARGKPNWWGILMIVPFANLVVPGYLAWAD